jgi:hypothetical protein
MSLRSEQHRALLRSRDLLSDILHPSTRPKTVGELKERALAALRHFPFLRADGEPMFSQDSFSEQPSRIISHDS